MTFIMTLENFIQKNTTCKDVITDKKYRIYHTVYSRHSSSAWSIVVLPVWLHIVMAEQNTSIQLDIDG